MPNEYVTQLLERKMRGEDGLDGAILDSIARDMYAHPSYYGMRSEEEVGELFERYWTRIAGLVNRYEDVGASFDTFVKTSMRFMALSIRRRKALEGDKEAIFLADRRAVYESDIETSGDEPPLETPKPASPFPRPDDQRLSAIAFRKRMKFLCVKCANMIDDFQATTIARAAGLDEDDLLTCMALARTHGLGLKQRSLSRRRGRDAAWLRMGVYRRRLSREADPYKRRRLEEAFDNDRRLYLKAIALIDRSIPAISNKAVADLLGVPKGTVDCGVARILKQYANLYTDHDG